MGGVNTSKQMHGVREISRRDGQREREVASIHLLRRSPNHSVHEGALGAVISRLTKQRYELVQKRICVSCLFPRSTGRSGAQAAKNAYVCWSLPGPIQWC